MRIFDRIKARFPSIFGRGQEKAWAVAVLSGPYYDLYRGDGKYIGSYGFKWEVEEEAKAQGLMLFDD